MPRSRLLVLVLAGFVSVLIFRMFFHSGDEREPQAMRAGNRNSATTGGGDFPVAGEDRKTGVSLRGTARSRARSDALAGLRKKLDSLESGRIFDRSTHRIDPNLAVLLRSRLGLENSTSEMGIDVAQIALDAPTPAQAEEIRSLIGEMLPESLFDDAQERQSLVNEHQARYLNFTDKVKLVNRYIATVADTGEKHEWITGVDTVELMERQLPGGTVLSPKSLEGNMDSSSRTVNEGLVRYGHLFR